MSEDKEMDSHHGEDVPDVVHDEGTVFAGDTKLSKKFSHNEWQAAEKKCSKFQLAVGDCLDKLGFGITSTNTNNDLFVLGESLYLMFRELLRKPKKMIDDAVIVAPVLDQQNKKKGGGKHKGPSKADLIRAQNTKSRVESKITDVLITFSEDTFQPHCAFNSEIVEIKGIGLIYSGWYLFNNKNKYTKLKDLPFIFGIMVTMQRFLNICAGFKGKSLVDNLVQIDISPTLLKDVDNWLQRLIEIFPYTGNNIYKYAPELLVTTEYDKAIPSAGIKPRDHQVQLINCINTNIKHGCFVVYNPMIGEGKTTMIRALARLVMKKRIEDPACKHLQVIFACNLVSVKNQAANLCYNGFNGTMGPIKFGVASRNEQTGKYKISNHYFCAGSDEDRTVIITSPEIAAEILKDNLKNDIYGDILQRTILYLDEPTIGADIPGSESLKNNMSVMTVLPKYSIMSSATFPDVEFIEEITNNYSDKYPSSLITTIYSSEIRIGCDVYTFDKNLVVPHLGAQSSEELSFIIDVIKKCPFLGRVYTPHVAQFLYQKMIAESIPDVPDINKLFMNVDNMSSNEVRKIAMNMLCILSDQSNEKIKRICSSVILAEEERSLEEKKIEEKKEELFEWDTTDDKFDDPSTPLDFDKLGTVQAWRCPNTTLVAVPNPVEFVRSKFGSLLNDIYASELTDGVKSDKAKIYKSTENIIKIYNREISFFEKQKESIERNIENQDMLSQKLQDFENQKPTLRFPSFAQINTKEHIHKYALKHVNKLVGRYIRPSMCLDKIPFDKMEVPDDVLTLLLAGVGIYVAFHPELDDVYLQTVLDMASDGKLAYIIADNSICFGTNYPINRVIITDEFASLHSINTLFQLMGRAGRVGRSWVAEVYVSYTVAKRIINYTRDMKESEIEANNMTTEFVRVLKYKEEKEALTLQKMLEKFMPKPACAEPVMETKPITTVCTDSEQNKLEKSVELTEPAIITVKEPTPTIVKPIINTPAVISTPTVTTALVKPVNEIDDVIEIAEPKSSLNWRRRETTSILSTRSDSKKDDHPVNEKYVPPYLRRSDDVRQDSFGGRNRETKYNDHRDSRDYRDHRTEETNGRDETHQDVKYSKGRGETHQDVRYSRGRGETYQDVRYSRGRGERFDESRHNSYDDSRPSFGRGGGRGRGRDTRYDSSSTITSGSWRKSS